MQGALVLSVDFELAWGVRQHVRFHPEYAGRILAGREVVPRLLDLFASRRIAATWAVVGSLFADGRAEWERWSPTRVPRFGDPKAPGLFDSPYSEPVGESEAADPLHFAPSLIRRIRDTERQEIATHTFGHLECLRMVPDPEVFRADLRAAKRAAAHFDVQLQSIVFPRNQRLPAYDAVLLEEGIAVYRGNPADWMWRIRDDEEGDRAMRRAARALDAYLPVPPDARRQRWGEVDHPGALSNVRASFFLRPASPRRPLLERRRLGRLVGAMEKAARNGEILHLWWHPHNFGKHPELNLAFLAGVLDAFGRLRRERGMLSLTMAGAAARARDVERGRSSGEYPTYPPPSAAAMPPASRPVRPADGRSGRRG